MLPPKITVYEPLHETVGYFGAVLWYRWTVAMSLHKLVEMIFLSVK